MDGDRLQEELWKIQEDLGLSDAALAKEIGVNQSTISRMKSGDRGKRVTLQFAQKVIRRFPELSFLLAL